ncbi:TetR/AcrR family transcriptional regulator [Mycolicibacterium moriokaense]|uniref:TetR family transcriptional regulator n=1 Tax=Mycolicibacterium moriokaense TaxID=39691 RepID=A0A318H6M1_9MYCO|nr:TetR/AcrR family transcriptional regulator [Mycolicibacterium moriokaense]PXW99893.1 TetR family transcriptional regulator [Mycolicibacterium moriokaense]
MTVQPEKRAKGSIKGEIAEFKRKQILDAAVELFHRNGYHGTSVDAIAGVLGVSKQFVYYQFKDKPAILDAVCTTGAELTLSAVNDSDELAGSTVDKMRLFCTRLTEIVIDHGRYLEVYASEVSTLRDEDRKRTLAIRAEVDDRVCELIDRGCREGVFVAEDPLIAARAVTGMISFMWTWAHPDDPAGRAGLVEHMTQIALRALGINK